MAARRRGSETGRPSREVFESFSSPHLSLCIVVAVAVVTTYNLQLTLKLM